MRSGYLFVVLMLVSYVVLPMSYSDDQFEYHAYIRSGVLENGKGGKGAAFQAPGASAKYRLGNEAETYGEAILVKNFNKNEEGPSAKVETLLAYKTQQNNQWSSSTDEFTIREAFAEFGNFSFSPSAKLWAGNRFYKRHDIHIDDFYWLDTSGYGGGMEDYAIGDMKFSIAYLRGSPDDAVELDDVGLITKQVLDLRLANINVGFGELEVVALPSYVKGGDYETTLTMGDDDETTTTSVDDEYGIGVCIIHNKGYDAGFNKAGVQWGNSVAKDFNSSLWSTPDRVTSDTWRLRLLDFGVWSPNDSWSMMYVGIWDRLDNGQDEDNLDDWLSLGVRPVYSFNRNFSLAVEMGVDYTRQEGAGDDGDDLSGALGKLTVCPQVALDSNFFARPVLRAFITVAQWSSDFEGKIGGEAYKDDTAGMNYGVQMEAWF